MPRGIRVTSVGSLLIGSLLAVACSQSDSTLSGRTAALSTEPCAQADENTTATLECPAGQTITKIVFASYGTADGTCGSFAANAACNATNSTDIVSAACIGKNSCSVDANNGVFGDPCWGTHKSLAIEAQCSGGSSPTTPTTPSQPSTPSTPANPSSCTFNVSLAAVTGHNTSASPNYDKTHFPANFGTTTWTSQSGQTMSVDPNKSDLSMNPITPGHVSSVDVHTLVPSRPDLRWFAHLTPWFTKGTGRGHIDIGLENNSNQYIDSMIADVKRRGFDGVIIDWYGSSHYIDTFSLMLQQRLQARGGNDFTYMLMFDQGIPNLSEGELENQLRYAQGQYFSDPNYEHENGKAFVMFIGVDDRVGQSAMYSAKANAGANQIWVNQGVDVSKTWVDQVYDWTHNFNGGIPAGDTDRYNLNDLAGYYAAVKWSGKEGFGSMEAGFNGMLTRSVSWSQGRYLPRDSGACQMETAKKTDAVIPPTIKRMQYATWSDWEEGTAIEAGVENDAVVSASVNGTTLAWQVSTGTNDESTIDHYEIYASVQGDAAMKLGAVPAGTHSFDLRSVSCMTAGGYKVYVSAVGRPNIRDHISQAVDYSAP